MPITFRSEVPAMRGRRGFTLVELLIVIVLLSIVMGALMTVIIRQQRFYRGANQIVDARSQMRQAAGILPMEIRGLSSIGGDIRFLSDSALEFRSTYGSSIVCAVAGTTITLPPAVLASGNVLTAFLSQPANGDVIFVHDTLRPPATPWTQHTINSNPTTTLASCLPVTGFVAVGDATTPRTTFTITPALGPGAGVGAAIRFTRPVRYSLYRASDQKWYLGYNELRGGAWVGIQPVSGPYRPYANNANASGVFFQYFTAAGAPVTNLAGATTVARVQVNVNGQSQQAVSAGQSNATTFQDSLRTSIAIRNRI